MKEWEFVFVRPGSCGENEMEIKKDIE